MDVEPGRSVHGLGTGVGVMVGVEVRVGVAVLVLVGGGVGVAVFVGPGVAVGVLVVPGDGWADVVRKRGPFLPCVRTGLEVPHALAVRPGEAAPPNAADIAADFSA